MVLLEAIPLVSSADPELLISCTKCPQVTGPFQKFQATLYLNQACRADMPPQNSLAQSFFCGNTTIQFWQQ
jgi:hypothetical protein